MRAVLPIVLVCCVLERLRLIHKEQEANTSTTIAARTCKASLQGCFRRAIISADNGQRGDVERRASSVPLSCCLFI